MSYRTAAGNRGRQSEEQAMPGMLTDRYPLFREELRRRVYGRRMRRVPVLKALLYVAVGIGLLPLLGYRHPEWNRDLWNAMNAVQVFLLVLLGSGLAVSSFTAERERGSLDFLFLTPLTTRSIVMQKYAGACALPLLIILFFLPISLMMVLLEYVTALTFVATLLLAVAQGAAFVALGLAASALARNTRAAVAVTLGMIAALEFGGRPLLIELLQSAVVMTFPALTGWCYGSGLNLLLVLLYLLPAALLLRFCVSAIHHQRTPIAHGAAAPRVSRSTLTSPRWRLPDRHPVLWDDLRRRLRGGRAFTVMLGFGLALCAILVIGTKLSHFEFSPEALPKVGRALFIAVMIGQGVMMLVISPGLTATIFSSERENRRIDFLLISRLTSRELVYGKCFGAVALLLLTLISGAPVIAIIAATFGGVSPWEFGLGYLGLLLIGLFCASTALLFSCKAKNSSAALVQGYLISILGLAGAVGLGFIFMLGALWAIIEVIRNLNHAARRLDDWRRHLEQDPYTLPLMKEAEDNQ